MPALAMAFGIAIAGDVVKSSGGYANLMDQKNNATLWIWVL
jgi:hypothetical protein